MSARNVCAAVLLLLLSALSGFGVEFERYSYDGGNPEGSQVARVTWTIAKGSAGPGVYWVGVPYSTNGIDSYRTVTIAPDGTMTVRDMSNNPMPATDTVPMQYGPRNPGNVGYVMRSQIRANNQNGLLLTEATYEEYRWKAQFTMKTPPNGANVFVDFGYTIFLSPPPPFRFYLDFANLCPEAQGWPVKFKFGSAAPITIGSTDAPSGEQTYTKVSFHHDQQGVIQGSTYMWILERPAEFGGPLNLVGGSFTVAPTTYSHTDTSTYDCVTPAPPEPGSPTDPNADSDGDGIPNDRDSSPNGSGSNNPGPANSSGTPGTGSTGNNTPRPSPPPPNPHTPGDGSPDDSMYGPMRSAIADAFSAMMQQPPNFNEPPKEGPTDGDKVTADKGKIGELEGAAGGYADAAKGGGEEMKGKLEGMKAKFSALPKTFGTKQKLSFGTITWFDGTTKAIEIDVAALGGAVQLGRQCILWLWTITALFMGVRSIRGQGAE